jgi:hypothetical protein
LRCGSIIRDQTLVIVRFVEVLGWKTSFNCAMLPVKRQANSRQSGKIPDVALPCRKNLIASNASAIRRTDLFISASRLTWFELRYAEVSASFSL